MRSRAVALPRACCFSTAFSEAGVRGGLAARLEVGDLACRGGRGRRGRGPGSPALRSPHVLHAMSTWKCVPVSRYLSHVAPPTPAPSDEVRRTSHDPRSWDDDALQRRARPGRRRRLGTGGRAPLDRLDQRRRRRAGAARRAPEGFTVVADEQTDGPRPARPHLGVAVRRGLAMSVVLRPVVPEADVGLAPAARRRRRGRRAGRARGWPPALKWPNDVVVDGDARDGSPGPRKLGGLLVERVRAGRGGRHRAQRRPARRRAPVPRATSTRLEGADVEPRAARRRRPRRAAPPLPALAARRRRRRRVRARSRPTPSAASPSGGPCGSLLPGGGVSRGSRRRRRRRPPRAAPRRRHTRAVSAGDVEHLR